MHLFYTAVLESLEAHGILAKSGESLLQVLKDYLLSKELQKQEILNNINRFKQINIGDFVGSVVDRGSQNQYFNKKK